MIDKEVENEIQTAFLKLHNLILEQQLEIIKLKKEISKLNSKVDQVSMYAGAN
jgi:hypothetical protein